MKLWGKRNPPDKKTWYWTPLTNEVPGFTKGRKYKADDDGGKLNDQGTRIVHQFNKEEWSIEIK